MKELLAKHGTMENVLFVVMFVNMALSSLKMLVEKFAEFAGKKIEDYKFMYYVNKALTLLTKLLDLMMANVKHK
ncbi:MAG: hypothetical protein E6R04_07050 [Spirochaetes bacterium]|nr:MAG: hypothetical protein E6R04_07050 [Spirochaetota bacterium]